MVLFLKENKRPSTGELLARGLSQGVDAGLGAYTEMAQKQQQMAQENKAVQQLTGMDLSGITDPDQRKAVITELVKQQGKQQRLGQTQDFLSKIFGGNVPRGTDQDFSQGFEGAGMESGQQLSQQFDPSQLSDADIAQASALDPNLGRILQQQKDVGLRERREKEKRETEKFLEERKYHTGYSKSLEEATEKLRDSLPRKEMALDFARNSIESGDIGSFSLANLAERLSIPELQTAKGAQLITAGKENLLSNMARVSARAQNIWFEKRLSSMFPQIGQNREANLTMQEMLEAEADMDKAYLSAFDRIKKQDEDQYGFVKKDIGERVRNDVRSAEKEIMRRASYRMKEIEEQEKSPSTLKKDVGKNVIKGTPLTLQMAKLYKDKFGNDALKVAEKNGYYIPTIEEFKIFQQRPGEFREGLM